MDQIFSRSGAASVLVRRHIGGVGGDARPLAGGASLVCGEFDNSVRGGRRG